MAADSTLPQFRVVGFTGHRQLSDPQATGRAIADALESLRSEAPGDWIGLSSVATGSDQVFVAQVLERGLSWEAILPLPRAEFRADFAPAEWSEVERLLAHAGHVRVINENGSREDGYLDCGMETVNGADVLIALWDGQPARGRGGTADVVEYAISVGKPVLILDAATLEPRRDHWTSLQHADTSLAELNKLPDAVDGGIDNPFKAPARVYRFQRKCDSAASRGAPQFRRLIVSTVLLHVLATLIAAMALAYSLHGEALPWAKLACLIGALGVALVLRRHSHSHSNWVRCRLAAEFCRSALATWGLPQAAPLFQDLNLAGLRGLTRSLHILHSRSVAARQVSVEEFKEIYIGRL